MVVYLVATTGVHLWGNQWLNMMILEVVIIEEKRLNISLLNLEATVPNLESSKCCHLFLFRLTLDMRFRIGLGWIIKVILIFNRLVLYVRIC